VLLLAGEGDILLVITSNWEMVWIEKVGYFQGHTWKHSNLILSRKHYVSSLVNLELAEKLVT
jgi:hypothetical protein